MPRIICLLLSLLTATALMAADDIRGSKDYPGLSRFPGAFIVQYKEQSITDYRLALGVLEKINGVLAAEDERRIAADLTRITYRIPDSHTPDEVLSFYQGQLRGKVLFQCSGRACGSSNQWANQVFRYSRLYGVDKTQRYSVWQQDDKYVVLYTVQRGNKRVYLRLDILQTEQQAQDDSKASFVLSEEEQGVNQLIEFLTANAQSTVWLVAFSNNEAVSYSASLQKAENRLEALRQKLMQTDIPADRYRLQAVGRFATHPALKGRDGIIVYSESK